MKIVKIEVTEEDIDRGEACVVVKCAMALALERAVPLAISVRACSHHAELFDVNNRMTAIPHGQDNWILAFDMFKKLGSHPRPNPITFDLEVPDCFVPQEPIRTKKEEYATTKPN